MLQRLGHNVSSIIVKNFGVADGSVCQSVDHASLPFSVAESQSAKFGFTERRYRRT
jgi:hypothetical protein